MKMIGSKVLPAGMKTTKPRLEVLKFLKTHRSPISARELHKKMKYADQASVYRTLNIFEEKHFVNVEVIGKEKLYCLATKPHHHIFCKKCGYAEEVECKHSFGQFKNFSNVYHQLILAGICNKCAA